MRQDNRRTFDTVEPTSDHEKVLRRKIYEDMTSVDVIVEVLGSEKTDVNGNSEVLPKIWMGREDGREESAPLLETLIKLGLSMSRDNRSYLATPLKAQADG